MLLLLYSTVNSLSLLRPAFLKTRLYDAASNIRFWRKNRSVDVLDNSVLSFVVAVTVATGLWRAGYGVSCARPFARRRFRTRRPALVAIRARKPWVRARFKLLGWNVRFMALNLLYRRALIPDRKKAGKSTRGLNYCQ